MIKILHPLHAFPFVYIHQTSGNLLRFIPCLFSKVCCLNVNICQPCSKTPSFAFCFDSRCQCLRIHLASNLPGLLRKPCVLLGDLWNVTVYMQYHTLLVCTFCLCFVSRVQTIVVSQRRIFRDKNSHRSKLLIITPEFWTLWYYGEWWVILKAKTSWCGSSWQESFGCSKRYSVQQWWTEKHLRKLITANLVMDGLQWQKIILCSGHVKHEESEATTGQ